MQSVQVEVSYKGRTETLNIITSDLAAVMSPEKFNGSLKKIRRVTQSPNNPTTEYYGATGKEERVGPGVRTFKAGTPAVLLGTYTPDEDPERFIIDWRLHGAALLKDQEVEGAKLSDWCFFDAQIKAIHRSTLWGLRNKLKLSYNTACAYAEKGSEIFKYEVLLTRGVNLDEPISDADAANDREIMRHQAMKEFHASQSKRF